jgi:hypothetical protein
LIPSTTPEEPLIKSYQSTKPKRTMTGIGALLVALFLASATQAVAQSKQSEDSPSDASVRVAETTVPTKTENPSSVVNVSSEALRKRLADATAVPTVDEDINTIVSRTSTLPTPPQKSSSEPKFLLTPYVWMASLKGDVGAEAQVIHVDAPFSEVIDEVNFGFAMVFEARFNEKWFLLTDLNYLNLSDDKPTPGPLYDGAQLNIKSFFFSGEAGYKVAGSNSVRFDLTGGFRVFHQSMNIELRRGATRRTIDQGATWVDPIVGFRLRGGDKVFVTLKGDIGGFGAASTFTFHLFGGGGVNVGKHMTIVAGYRYLDVDYRSKDFVYDTAMSGLLLGFGLRF